MTPMSCWIDCAARDTWMRKIRPGRCGSSKTAGFGETAGSVRCWDQSCSIHRRASRLGTANYWIIDNGADVITRSPFAVAFAEKIRTAPGAVDFSSSSLHSNRLFNRLTTYTGVNEIFWKGSPALRGAMRIVTFRSNRLRKSSSLSVVKRL